MNNTAAVFPGQGSQKPGMAADFHKEYPIARQTFEEACDALGEDIKPICFEENPRIYLTEYGQPCILAAEIAMMRVLHKEFGFLPEFAAGHSLGEYTALVATDVIPFSDAIQIARKRAQLMQTAVPVGHGGMAAIKLKDIENHDYEQLVKDSGAEVANFNSPNQVVISGSKDAVLKASSKILKEFAEQNVEVVPLEVSAPFHCSLMQPIEADFRAFLSSFSSNFNLENCRKVAANFTSSFHTPDKLVDNLIGQISGPVYWVEIMRLLTKKAEWVYEVGPSRPLGSFFRSIGKEVKSIVNLRSAKKAFPDKILTP